MLRQRLKILIACVLTVLCAAGAVRAVKAASVSSLQRQATNGFFHDSIWEKRQVTDPDKVIQYARIAEKRYPEGYHMFAHAASISWDTARAARDNYQYAEFDKYIGQALHFSQKALALNPYGEQTRRVYVDVLIELGRTTEAIDYWRGIMDMEFWYNGNHDKMAYLLMCSDNPEHLREAVTMMTPPPGQNHLWIVNDPVIRKKLRAYQSVILR